MSFSGSPTVSPVTAALCFSLPLPVVSVLGSSSIVFLALSQAPPALAMKTASNWPTTIMPPRKPARAIDAQAVADQDRHQHGQQTRADQFLLGRRRCRC